MSRNNVLLNSYVTSKLNFKKFRIHQLEGFFKQYNKFGIIRVYLTELIIVSKKKVQELLAKSVH